MVHEAQNLERDEFARDDRYLAASNDGTSFALQYHVDRAVLNDLLGDRYVPIFKLLPGYRNEGGSLSVINGQLVTAGGENTKLERQTLTVNQLVFGLMKYKSVVSNARPDCGVGGDIDNHITNILEISMKYSSLSYFLYHRFVWTHFFGKAFRSWGGNWVTVDAQALHAAISGVAGNSCADCGSYYHEAKVCPFTLRKEQPTAPFKTQAVSKTCDFYNNM